MPEFSPVSLLPASAMLGSPPPPPPLFLTGSHRASVTVPCETPPARLPAALPQISASTSFLRLAGSLSLQGPRRVLTRASHSWVYFPAFSPRSARGKPADSPTPRSPGAPHVDLGTARARAARLAGEPGVLTSRGSYSSPAERPSR